MTTVVLVIHLMIALALVGVVLMQRSEGGALGIGGSGGGGGGFLTGRGTANLLTRVTAGLALGFFVTSLTLSILAKQSRQPSSIFDTPANRPGTSGPAVPGSTPSQGGAPVVPGQPKSSPVTNDSPVVPKSK